MELRQKKVLITLTAIIAAAAILYYFVTHFPVGTFNHASKNADDPAIEIKMAENLLTFIDADYDISIKIGLNGRWYEKNYETSGDDITLLVLNNNGTKSLSFTDNWKGSVICEGGSCSDFNSIRGQNDYAFNENDSTYTIRHAQPAKADTLSCVLFSYTMQKFIRLR